MHAVTLFGNLQSFMRQALDQALATQALWYNLSSRVRVSLGLWESQGRGFHIGYGAMLGGLSSSLPQFPHLGGGLITWWLAVTLGHLLGQQNCHQLHMPVTI